MQSWSKRLGHLGVSREENDFQVDPWLPCGSGGNRVKAVFMSVSRYCRLN